MVKIHFLGTSSGTEPQPGRHHTSFILEYDNRLFIFDAGEGCGYTAHLSGVDLLKTEAIFISHPHMDHIGGLPHLLWTIKKLEARGKKPMDKEIELHLPTMDIWLGVEKLMFLKGRALKNGVEFKAQRIIDGLIYNNYGVKVETVHNLHLGMPSSETDWMSFSFLIEVNNKRLVYSGDFKKMDEIKPLLNNIDLLLVETGHHSVEEICNFLVVHDIEVKEIGFMHHGRAILANPQAELSKAKTLINSKIFIADDGMVKHL